MNRSRAEATALPRPTEARCGRRRESGGPGAGARVHALLAACGGFLLATLWFDLMFDVQVVGHAVADLPDPVVASIAAYYRRVTTDAHPMQWLVAAVMAVAVAGAGWTARTGERRGLRWAALATAALPIALAVVRVFPDAVRLGTRTGSLADQRALARAIFADHVVCLAAIVAFTALEIALAVGSSGSPAPASSHASTRVDDPAPR